MSYSTYFIVNISAVPSRRIFLAESILELVKYKDVNKKLSIFKRTGVLNFSSKIKPHHEDFLSLQLKPGERITIVGSTEILSDHWKMTLTSHKYTLEKAISIKYTNVEPKCITDKTETEYVTDDEEVDYTYYKCSGCVRCAIAVPVYSDQ